MNGEYRVPKGTTIERKVKKLDSGLAKEAGKVSIRFVKKDLMICLFNIRCHADQVGTFTKKDCQHMVLQWRTNFQTVI